MKIPYGPSHITHTVVDVEQRHSLVAWGGRWCSLVRQTWCSPHHELEQQSHSLVASGASLARLSPRPCIPLLQGPWWWILTCVSLHITSSLYHCKWLHHPPHDFDKLASIWGQGSGSQCPGLCIMSVPPGKRQEEQGKKQKHKKSLFSERSRRLRCPDCSFAFLCWLLSSALISFKASFRDHTRTDNYSYSTFEIFLLPMIYRFFLLPPLFSIERKIAEKLCREQLWLAETAFPFETENGEVELKIHHV